MTAPDLRQRPAHDGGRWVHLRRRYNAPPYRVFRAWADPEELARWLPDRVEGGMAVGARCVLVWADRRVWWDITHAEPNRAFAFRRPWLPDERLITDVRLTIEPAGYGTNLELTDGPFPPDDPDALEAWAECIGEWTEDLTLLRAHLDFSVDVRQRG